jgi:hypothetical protein
MKATTGPAPLFLHPSAASTIPADLRALPRWLCWCMEDNRKTPKDPRRPRHKGGFAWGDCTRLADFGTAFASARAAGEGFGVGFVLLLEDGFTALDLDDCLDAEGVAKPWARPLLDKLEDLGAYVEISARSQGLRSIVRGTLPAAFSEVVLDGKAEGWSSGRWVAFTGRRISDGDEIPEADPVELLAPYAKPKQAPPSARPQESNGTRPEPEGCPERILRKLLEDAEEKLGNGAYRNKLLFDSLVQARDNGASREQAEGFMRDFIALCERHPRDHSFEPKEARDTLRSVFSKPARDPWSDSLDALANSPGIAEQRPQGFLIGESPDPEEDAPPTQWGAPGNEGEASNPATFEWKEPKLLDVEAEVPPIPPGVLRAFPDWILSPIIATAETFESAEDFGVLSALAALSFVGLGTVTTKSFAKWHKPQPVNFFALATAPPGRGKSETLALFCGPLDEIEENRLRIARRDFAREAARREVAKATLGKLKESAAKGDGAAMDQFLDLSEEAAREPLLSPRNRIASQSTPEALADVALTNGGQFCLLSAEPEALAQLLPTYRNGPKIVPEVVTSAFDAKACRQVRSGEGKTREIPSVHGVLCILAQGTQLGRILCEPTFAESGFLSRCLLSAPKLPPKTGDPEDGRGVSARVEEAYRSRLVELGEWLAQFKSPGVIQYSTEALAELKPLYRELNARRDNEGGDLHKLAVSLARVEQVAIRVGALVHLARHERKAFELPVEGDVAAAACDLARYHCEHAKAMLAPTDPAIDLARKVLDLAMRQGQRADWRPIQQSLKRGTGWAHIEAAVELLEERHLARRLEEPASPQGGRPRVFLDVNPALFERGKG